MSEVNPAGFFQNLATHTAEQMRSYLGGFLAVPAGAASLKTASAVHPGIGGALAVAQNGTPNMSVNVSSGLAFVSGGEGTKQGTYICLNDGTVNKTITAAHATLNRRDLIVCRVQDSAYSGATNAWDLFVVTGTPASSPSDPTAPSNSVILARVTIAAAASSITNANITDLRPWNAALGGIAPCTSSARPSNPYSGLHGYELDTKRTIRYDGTNWHQLGIHICTSSTRPSGPYTGMRIYETDTSLEYQWNGSKWLRDTTYKYKASSESRASTTSLVNDTDIQWAGEANATYVFEANLFIFGDATVDMKVGMGIPAGGTARYTFSPSQTSGVSAGAFDSTTWHGSTALNDPSWTVGLLTNPNHSYMRWAGYIALAGTAGTIAFQWAQANSNVAAIFVEQGSWLQYKQVA